MPPVLVIFGFGANTQWVAALAMRVASVLHARLNDCLGKIGSLLRARCTHVLQQVRRQITARGFFAAPQRTVANAAVGQLQPHDIGKPIGGF